MKKIREIVKRKLRESGIDKRYFKKHLGEFLEIMLSLALTGYLFLLYMLELNNSQKQVMQLLIDTKMYLVMILFGFSLCLIGNALARAIIFIGKLIYKLTR